MMPRPGRPQLGALSILMLCFALSGLLRLVVAAPALAQQLSGAPPGDAAVDGCGPGSEELLAAIRERTAQIEVREDEIAERRAVLEIAEEQFARKQAALLEAEEQLAATLSLADGAAERDIDRLTAIYENVKPKRAAEIFNSMDANFATGVLSRMDPAAAAEILTRMEAEKAYAISVLLAARNVNAGDAPPPAN